MGNKAMLIGSPANVEEMKKSLIARGWAEDEIIVCENPTTKDIAAFYGDAKEGDARYLHCVGRQKSG